ncbi:cupin domain-containing protein [Azorhizobium doebereinerae]|uniref:cupin domain-containing protein n=1 Tax=Azorhizobium doebereinerae TaxID=281091 RepID=UPI00040B512E|nr:cupin domain-containing protein [Azorhizobium doebereinerae]
MADLSTLSAAQVIARLDLLPHPEGGHYRETFRDMAPEGTRAASTAIYFLLQAGECSHWHRVDASETWHHYAGAPLALRIAPEGEPARTLTLGTDLGAGQEPQGVVPPFVWQSAETLGAWTLVGCTVAPAFLFSGFQLAPPDWAPPQA